MVHHNLKQVIIVCTELGMRRGKMIAQACHASVRAAIKTFIKDPKLYRLWDSDNGHKKVTLWVNTQDELDEIYRHALEAGLTVVEIIDQGLTQIPPNSITAVAIGPHDSDTIDKITGHLKLLQ